MKLNVKVIKTLKFEGDFYIVFFKEAGGKGDRHSVYLAGENDLKKIKKLETESHGEPVIIEKMCSKELKKHKKRLIQGLNFVLKREDSISNKLPIKVGVYID